MHQWEDKLTKIYENLYIQKTLQLIHFILIKILILTNAIRIKIEFKCQLNVLYLKVIYNTDPPTIYFKIFLIQPHWGMRSLSGICLSEGNSNSAVRMKFLSTNPPFLKILPFSPISQQKEILSISYYYYHEPLMVKFNGPQIFN